MNLALERRAKRRAQIVIGVLAIAFILGTFLTVGIFRQSREASRQRDIAAEQRDVARKASEETLSAFLVAQAENALEDGKHRFSTRSHFGGLPALIPKPKSCAK